jgi:DNA transformation protein
VAVSAATRAFALELFGGVGGVTARAMMGGLALYADGRIFALVGPEDRIFLKADGAFAAALAAEGAQQFVYVKAGKPVRVAYWTLPEPALDDPAEACAWARRALAAAYPGFS